MNIPDRVTIGLSLIHPVSGDTSAFISMKSYRVVILHLPITMLETQHTLAGSVLPSNDIENLDLVRYHLFRLEGCPIGILAHQLQHEYLLLVHHLLFSKYNFPLQDQLDVPQ